MQKLAHVTGFFLMLSVSGLQAEATGMGANNAKLDESQAAIVINAPADGAVLTSYQPVKISYKIIPGAEGDHAHLYLDKFRVAMLHQPAGEHEIRMLHPGMHKIRIEIVTKDHHHIGVGKEITVDAR